MSVNMLARYEAAQLIMQGALTDRLVKNDTVYPHWIKNSNCCWYKRQTASGYDFRLVNPDDGSNEPAFDQAALASALSASSGASVDPARLPIKQITFVLTPLQVSFQAFGKNWRYEADNQRCTELPGLDEAAVYALQDRQIIDTKVKVPSTPKVSPDGTKAVYVRDFNLWLRDLKTGKDSQLTQDGNADYSYGCPGTLSLSGDAEVCWSPDSKHLLGAIFDTQDVASRPLISYVPKDGSLRPQLHETKLGYPGDEALPSFRLLQIDIEAAEVTLLDTPAIPFLLYSEANSGFFSSGLAWWAPDSQHAYFIEITRGSKRVRVLELTPATGAIRILIEERSDTYVKMRNSQMTLPLFRPMPESGELIWFSERSGWGHLYLYDLRTGELKNAITEGEWLVAEVLQCDTATREVVVQTCGRDPDINAYYRDICRINIDTGSLTELASGNYDHQVNLPSQHFMGGMIMLGILGADANGVPPAGRHLVATRSRVDTAPESILIDHDGKQTLLETADISDLPSDWVWPEPVKLKAADGHTDIYGAVFRPPGFSPDKKYPVINYSFNMPSFTALPIGSFVNCEIAGLGYYTPQALAALGFIVVALEGRGTPMRGKTFQDYKYGDFSSFSAFEDRIAGMRQLADRYPYIDLDRVGITGPEGHHNIAYAPLKYPEFFKVAVVNCHTDPRFALPEIGETTDGTMNAKAIAQMTHPEDLVNNFKGKMFLIVGMMSPMSVGATFRLVEALQKANKDFDMLCLPNERHEMTAYTNRREWDYFVEHLLGEKPPKEFRLVRGEDMMMEGVEAPGR